MALLISKPHTISRVRDTLVIDQKSTVDHIGHTSSTGRRLEQGRERGAPPDENY